MTYEALPVAACSELASVFAEYASMLPTNGFIIVGREHGRVVMFQCCHQVTHAGPVWIAPELRGQGLWRELQEFTEREMKKREITTYYQFGTIQNESQLRRLGLHPLGWTVWMKEPA